MIEFKSCIRCGGDVNVDSDWYGEFKKCLQCGWTKDLPSDPLSKLADVVRLPRDVEIRKAG